MKNLILSLFLFVSFQAVCQPCFTSSSQFSSGIYSDPLVVSDFNGDGNADLIIGNHFGPQVSLLFGNGNGGFSSPTAFSTAGSTRGLLAKDLDNDGLKDIVVCGSSASVAILKGLSGGSFSVMGQYNWGSQISVTGNDFNGDGFADLAFCNSNGSFGGVTVLKSAGSGSFGAPSGFSVSGGPYSIISSDFNQDAKPDLATANVNANNVSFFQGSGTGSFVFLDSVHVTTPVDILAADFNGDGRMDIAAASLAKTLGIHIFHKTAAGSFSLAGNFPLLGQPNKMASADFDNDGFLDLAITLSTFTNTLNLVAVLKGNGSGSFLPATNFSTHPMPTGLATGEFNSDGRIDLAVTHYTLNTASLLLNCSITGLSDFNSESSIEIWPNPGTKAFNIRTGISGNYNVQIINSIGQVLFTGQSSDSHSISIENFPTGMYTVVLSTSDILIKRKVIIEH
ncbi:MAG: T9SS type A sorting domain-containing protein [Bacteroidia bacterium]|nr:T9SS type A sorting domain-containing protein [Bacteroidia bacterium]